MRPDKPTLACRISPGRALASSLQSRDSAACSWTRSTLREFVTVTVTVTAPARFALGLGFGAAFASAGGDATPGAAV